MDELKNTDLKTRLLYLHDDTFEIGVVVNGAEFKQSLLEDLSVTPDADDLNLWLSRQPAKMAYWRIWSGKASGAVKDAERNYKKKLGEVRLRIRKEDHETIKIAMKEWGSLPVKEQKMYPKPITMTVDDLTASAENDPEVDLTWRQLVHAREVFVVLDAAFKAVDALKSTLISLAANMRSETSSFRNKIKPLDEDQGTMIANRQTALNSVRKEAQIAHDVREKEVQKHDIEQPLQPTVVSEEMPSIIGVSKIGEEPLTIPEEIYIIEEEPIDEIQPPEDVVSGPCPDLVQALMMEKVHPSAKPTEKAPDNQNGASQEVKQDTTRHEEVTPDPLKPV